MEKKQKIRLVISDIDGTLLDPDGELSPVDFVAVGRLRQAGVKFSLSSARPPFGMQWLIRMLGVDCTCAALNGAVLLDPMGSVYTEMPLERALVDELEDRMRKCGADVWVYTREAWFVPRLSGPRVRQNTEALRTAPIRYARFNEITEPVLKLVGASSDSSVIENCTSELRREFSPLACVTASLPHYIDVTHLRADKGHAAVAVALTEGVLKEEVAAIGDSPGDVPMFHEVGLSVAMGQADEEVRAAASQVTRSNAQNGLAWAIEYLLSGKWAGHNPRIAGSQPSTHVPGRE
jgi:Cof subfamily protein (haloacid dehalogenase superfamily)